MNIIAFNGSPRKSWNTATLLNKALEGATSAGAETELIHLYDLIIREERKDDYLSVYRVVKSAFGGTEYTSGDEQYLVVRLRGSSSFLPELSIVAEFNGEIIGHIMFTEAVIREGDKNHQTLTLGPVSVLPEYQKKGIGSRLIEEGHDAARRLGYRSVLLVGHPEYYPRFGYRPAEVFGIKTYLELPPRVFMACELTKNGLEGVSGTVNFAPEFNL